jgi:predicted nucleic acid-binding protein
VIVVLDTNVWISALQFARHRGTPTRALEKADVLVAGDKDLLVLGIYKGTRILTPAQYLEGTEADAE